jgi:hypothetical protein
VGYRRDTWYVKPSARNGFAFLDLIPKEKMELEGYKAVEYLRGPDTVRDGSLVDLSIHQLATEPVIELTFEVPHKVGTRIVKLELRAVREFEYGYEGFPEVIEMMKCLMTDEGDFFISLDPYDEREDFISDKDNQFFRSRFVKLTTQDLNDSTIKFEK